MRWWPWGRRREEPTVGPAESRPPLIGSAEPDGAWRDLPGVQRTLADPLRPVAINEDFRDSLTSYADPSFAAPLAHQIDPEAGGLVGGLVAPGAPYARPTGQDLAVPARTKPSVTRRRIPSAEQVHPPPIQRSVMLDDPADLSTVALELPETGWAAPGPQPPSAAPEALTQTEVATPTETARPVEATMPTVAAIPATPGGMPASTEVAISAEVAGSTDAPIAAEARGSTAAAVSAQALSAEAAAAARPEAVKSAEAPAPSEAAISAEAPAPTEAAMAQEFSAPAGAPSSASTFAPDAPPIKAASTRTLGVEASSGGKKVSQVPASVTPVRELPVVARSVDRSIGPELSRPPRTGESAQPSDRERVKGGPTTDSLALPVVGRSADPIAESAPVSGFAEAIINLTGAREAAADAGGAVTSDDQTAAGDDQANSGDDHAISGDHAATSYDHAPTGDDRAATGKDHVASSDDHLAASALPATAVPVQRVAREGQSVSGGEAELLVVAESAVARVVSDSSLPVVTSRHAAGSPSAEEGGQPRSEARSDKPTLGVLIARAPLTFQRSLMTERVSPPLEPAAQRVEFLAPRLAPSRPTTASSSTQSQVPSARPTSPATSAARMMPATATPAPSTQRLPSQDRKHGSNSPASHPLAGSRQKMQLEEPQPGERQLGERQPEEAQLDAPQVADTVAEASVQRLQSLDPTASTQAAPPELTLPPEMHANPTWEIDTVAEDLAGHPTADVQTMPAVALLPAGQSVVDAPKAPAVAEVSHGPAVLAEPWPISPPNPASQRDVPTRHGALPTVSRLAVDAPTNSTSRSSGANPRIVVGPSIPLQHIAASQVPSAGPSSPLIASRQAAANPSSSESPSGGEMSFASKFGSEGRSETGSPAADGFTSVQLQSADEATPTASEPAADADTPSTLPISSSAASPAAAGIPPVDLDEMARRLYEPLSARLKAELWLDRERAGVMSDAQ